MDLPSPEKGHETDVPRSAPTATGLRRRLGIAFDPDGNFYVLDMLNSQIVKVAQ